MLLTHCYQHHTLVQRKLLMLPTHCYQHHTLVQRKLIMLPTHCYQHHKLVQRKLLNVAHPLLPAPQTGVEKVAMLLWQPYISFTTKTLTFCPPKQRHTLYLNICVNPPPPPPPPPPSYGVEKRQDHRNLPSPHAISVIPPLLNTITQGGFPLIFFRLVSITAMCFSNPQTDLGARRSRRLGVMFATN